MLKMKSINSIFVVAFGYCLLCHAIADEPNIAPSLGHYRNPRFIKLFGTTTTTSVTSTITTVLTCYSNLAFNNAAPTACAATSSRRRKRRSIINDEPPAELKTKNSDNRFHDEEEPHQNINPSRTVRDTITMMTLDSMKEVDMKENRSGDNVPFVTGLEGTPQNTQRRVKRDGSNRQARLISNFDQYGMSVGGWDMFRTSTQTVAATSTVYSSTYVFQVDCTPASFSYSVCP